MTTVHLNGRRHQLAPSAIVGKGGEADVYDLGDGRVLKLFKTQGDPDYAGNPATQQAARLRLQEHQKKLPAFPRGLPSEVIAPQELAYDRASGGQVTGYAMRYLGGAEVLLRFGDRRYREQGGIGGNQVSSIFQRLHGLVSAVHAKGVVIGDFNDLNVLVDSSGQIYLVDADSMQFGPYLCHTYTARFLDPKLCEAPRGLTLAFPASQNSDWYAFSTMLFQSLLYVGPYGGVHRPKSGMRLAHDSRVLDRITVFHPDVVYPKPALPLGTLPDELLKFFQDTYEKDYRTVFPLDLLQQLRWTACTSCGSSHARAICPNCAKPGAVKQAVVIRGAVTATRIFQTHGRILQTAYHGGALRTLYHENDQFIRENGAVIATGGLDPELRFRLSSRGTVMGKGSRLLVIDSGHGANQPPAQHVVETVGSMPVFDANSHHYFWIQDGQLQRQGQLGPEHIGDVLAGRSLFWVGEKFGFGFYQAGRLTRSFVFDTRGRGLNDRVAMPVLPGQLIDATCVFSDRLAWFMVTVQDAGRLINRCFVITPQGDVVAQASAEADDGTWLGTGIRGRFAAGSGLFAATDEGIVSLNYADGTITVAKTFPDTRPFVDATTKLLPGDGGIYAVSSREITLLKIK